MNRILAATLVLAASACLPTPARAEIQNCINITSLPTVITTQGVYCLKQDLATAISNGTAIEIATNNVTLDCNGFKLGGLGAGLGTQAVGVGANARSNITVRNCNIRGFWLGVALGYGGDPASGPSGNLVEDNRIERSTRIGIYMAGDSSVVRNNLVSATGMNTGGENAIGIEAHMSVDVVDNTIDGVFQTPGAATGVYGILSWFNSGGTLANNRIRNLQASTQATGILTTFASLNMLIKDNIISVPTVESSVPIQCIDGRNLAVGNAVLGLGVAVLGCTDGGGNVDNLDL